MQSAFDKQQFKHASVHAGLETMQVTVDLSACPQLVELS